MLSGPGIVRKADSMRSSGANKSRRMEEILALREGRWDDVFPGMLPENFDRPFVANMIDIAAKDTAEVIAPLPSFNCTSANMVSDRARKFADKRSKIVSGYVDGSNLQIQMYSGVDRLLSYGYVVFLVCPDYDEKMPKILVDDTFKSYYQNDPFNRETLSYCRIFKRDLDSLIDQFPEAAAQLSGLRPEYHAGPVEVEICRWWDKDQQALVTMDGAIVLSRIPNKLDRCPARVVEMPKLGESVRGQYDDAIGVQAGRTLAQAYALQAMDESVNAPIAVPDDVQEFPMGPKEILRSQTPQAIGRINLQIPNGVFIEAQNLTAETRMATRYPEGRSGNIDASIITGQGVEALMGTFSTQTKTAQLLLARGLRDVISMCLEMDEKYFGGAEKTVRGDDAGSPYEISYIPSRDIRGDYTCDVTYGLAGGLDPNRVAVLVLQLQAGGLISDDTAMRQLPVDISVEDEKKKIAIETGRKALSQAMAGYAQAVPMMATQGGDPSAPVTQIAKYLQLVQKGEAIEEAVAAVFAPPPPPPESENPMENAAEGGIEEPGMPGAQPGAPAAPGGGAPAQKGGAQDLLMTLAGLTGGGSPNLQSTVSRRQAI